MGPAWICHDAKEMTTNENKREVTTPHSDPYETLLNHDSFPSYFFSTNLERTYFQKNK